jgi:hypothetical protein
MLVLWRSIDSKLFYFRTTTVLGNAFARTKYSMAFPCVIGIERTMVDMQEGGSRSFCEDLG